MSLRGSYVIIVVIAVSLLIPISAYATGHYQEAGSSVVTIEPLAGSKGLNVCGGETGVECFVPGTVTVEVGGKVIFSNTDSANHTFTSGTISDEIVGTVFDSGLIYAGEEEYWFPDTVGEFPYICLLHPWMVGVIVVTESTSYQLPSYPQPTLDTTPPKILKPTDITVNAKNQNGAIVTFDVLTIDDTDEIVNTICTPASNSFFTIGETRIICHASDSSGNRAVPISFNITVNAAGSVIPEWVKNVAIFWCDNKIDDTSFIEGIQYLIENDIITVSISTSGFSIIQEIPQWVKNNACWWSKDLITDKEFTSGIEFLVNIGIIRV